MPAFNNGFPATYQQMPNPYNAYNPYQQYQAYQQPMQQPVANNATAQQAAPQAMTPPTIHAEIIQIDGEADVNRWPVNAGASQMFITKAEDKIIIKTMGPNGPLPLDVFEKRPPAPPEPTFDPSAYVRRDEIDGLVAAAVAASQPAKRASKKEETEG